MNTELHKVTYLLTHWKYYEQNREYLNKSQIRDATFLFNALQRLTVDDFELLKAKYYDAPITKIGSVKAINDEICKDAYGLSLNDYKRKKSRILNRLINEIDNVMADFSHDLNKHLDNFILGINGWYVVGQANNFAGDILLTRDKERAGYFNHNNLFEGANEFNKLPLI